MICLLKYVYFMLLAGGVSPWVPNSIMPHMRTLLCDYTFSVVLLSMKAILYCNMLYGTNLRFYCIILICVVYHNHV